MVDLTLHVELGAVTLLACYIVNRIQGRRANLPPSPPKLPFLGHALSIPMTQAWKTFADWGKLYGPVTFAEALGRPMIIINTVSAARDLMEKKGAIFSNRPKLPVLEMIGWDVTLPLTQYNTPQYRKQRRLMQEHLGTSNIRSFDTVIEGRVQKFLERLLASPEQFHQDILGHVASIILEVVYDHSVAGVPSADPFVRVNEEAAKWIVATGNMGSTIIDLFPFLRHFPPWFPGMGLKRKIQMAQDALSLAFSLPFEEAKSKRFLSETPGSSAPAVLFKTFEKYKTTSEMSPQEEEDLRIFSGTFYLTGTETTTTALTAFFLAMVYNQEAQKRAQTEIDRVVGLDRLPLLSDRPSLPFIDCLAKEVLRTHPPIPLGLPHESTRMDQYHGWDIPGRSMIIPNIWHMMGDSKSFPEPEMFDPDRHNTDLDYGRSIDRTMHDPVGPVFGFGRRACPGRAFAESMMWITIANVLAAFDILPWRDPVTGEEILPVVECESDIVNAIKPFKCRIVPRKERLSQIARDN